MVKKKVSIPPSETLLGPLVCPQSRGPFFCIERSWRTGSIPLPAFERNAAIGGDLHRHPGKDNFFDLLPDRKTGFHGVRALILENIHAGQAILLVPYLGRRKGYQPQIPSFLSKTGLCSPQLRSNNATSPSEANFCTETFVKLPTLDIKISSYALISQSSRYVGF